jgi:hypothetical protein
MFATLESKRARDYIMTVTIDKDDKLKSLKVVRSYTPNDLYWKNKDYTATVKKYKDKNGNTYHAVRIVRFSDNAEIRFERYGYDSHYKTTTVEEMQKADWINNYNDYGKHTRHALMNAQKDSIHFIDVGYVKKTDFNEWSKW